jgi:hypothetical protein
MESGSRIVNVSSRAHYMCRDLQLTQGSFQTGPAGWCVVPVRHGGSWVRDVVR